MVKVGQILVKTGQHSGKNGIMLLTLTQLECTVEHNTNITPLNITAFDVMSKAMNVIYIFPSKVFMSQLFES